MNSKYFTVSFVSFFVVLIAGLVFLFSYLSSGDNIEITQVVWASIIFLFLIIGIVVITLFMNRSSGRLKK